MTHSLNWWAEFISRVGFPIFASSAMLYVLLSGVYRLPQEVAAARASIAEVKGDVGVLRGDLTTYRSETRADSARLTRIMQQICVNTAQSQEDRRGCFPE